MGMFDKLRSADEKTKSKARSIIEANGSPMWGGLAAAAYTTDGDFDYKDINKQYERYGIDPSDYASSGQISQGRSNKKSSKEMHAELTRRANNDYHSNEAIKAAALRGDKDAQYFAKNGVSSSYDMAKRDELLAKYHKENGHPGNFNSIHDRARLSYRENKKLIKAGEEKYGKYADDRYAQKSALEDLTTNYSPKAPEAPGSVDNGPIVRSDKMEAVHGRLEAAARGTGNAPPSLFGNENDAPAGTDDQKQAASNFLEDYKLDVIQGANLQHDIGEGLSNASRRVRDIYNR